MKKLLLQSSLQYNLRTTKIKCQQQVRVFVYIYCPSLYIYCFWIRQNMLHWNWSRICSYPRNRILRISIQLLCQNASFKTRYRKGTLWQNAPFIKCIHVNLDCAKGALGQNDPGINARYITGGFCTRCLSTSASLHVCVLSYGTFS